MALDIPGALKSLASAGSAITELSQWLKKSKGDARSLLSELKQNLIYLDMVLNDKIPLDSIIDKIKTDEYKRLSISGYDFNSLKHKKIPTYPSLKNSALASWSGKSTEELVENIYDKINDLKTRHPLLSNKQNYRWNIRVNNIRIRIWLLLRHVRTK